MKFSQHIVIYVPDESALLDLANEVRDDPPPGLTGLRVLRFRDKPGRFVIQADFDSWDSAEENNERQTTRDWAERMEAIIDGDPKYENLDVVAEVLP